MRIVFIGDIVGRSGREALETHLPRLREALKPDTVIVNGENAANGAGITEKICKEFYGWGVDCITTGNHVWDQREIIPYIARDERLLRPLNFPPGTPGAGMVKYRTQGGQRVSDAPCPSCGMPYPSNLLACATTLTPGVAELVRQALPGWSPERGLCPVCAKTYASHFAARRSHVSLHNSTEPHTTFPYYHAAEESLLSQAERLPDYHTLPAAGVTIAFLDSGYYPHPDLAQAAGWPGDVPARVSWAPEA